MKGWPGEPDMEYDVLMADGEAAVNAGKPITDVIFDFGNVLVYWDPVAVMTPRYSDELVEQILLPVAQSPHMHAGRFQIVDEHAGARHHAGQRVDEIVEIVLQHVGPFVSITFTHHG